jgi:hypothetical protein
VTTYEVLWPTPLQAGETPVLEVQQASSNLSWMPLVNISGGVASAYEGNTLIGMTTTAHVSDVARSFVKISNAGRDHSSTYGTAGSNWSSIAGTAYHWRLHRIKSGNAIGFSNVTQTASGLVTSAGQLLGTNTNDSAIAGNVGELLQSKVLVASATALTTNTAKDVTTITLTAGDWDVWGWVGITGTTAVIDILTASLSTTLNTLSGADTGGNTQIVQSSAIIDPNIVDVIVATPMLPVTVANGATTTYHLVTRARFGSGTASAYGWLQARRRR